MKGEGNGVVVGIEMLNAGDAAVPDSRHGTPFLRTRRPTRAAHDRPIGYVTSLLDPAHFAPHPEV